MLLKLSKKMKPKQFQLLDSGVGGHPNKIPFKCALFAVDTPSDGSPEGAGGKKIRIASAVCDQYLQTFVGMAFNIDYANGMSTHNPRFKVAVIEKAYRSMDGFAMVDGYIYGKDFPDVVATIRYYNGLAVEYGWEEYQFGASLEMEATVQNAADDQNVLEVMEFCGTGAAILFAEDAAFKMTSFAARNNKEVDIEMKPEELKAVQDSLKALTDGMTTLSASVQSVVTEVGSIKTEVSSIKSAGVPTKTDEKTDLQLTQEKLEKAEQDLIALKAAGTDAPAGQRKTITAAQLVSKFGAAGKAAAESSDFSSFCAGIDALNLSVSESMKLKMQAKAAFGQQESE